MITVTDNAKKQAIRLMEDEGKEGLFIRVGVQGGGCSGLMYQLTFDNQDLEGDKSFEDNGIKVVVDKKSFLYLIIEHVFVKILLWKKPRNLLFKMLEIYLK